ncbi:MAG: hypothetical protein Q8K78_11590, partial [Planctomycetaceae bacterium]|nr:hypothetical protein [Planctomycetaceae bacterium]
CATAVSAVQIGDTRSTDARPTWPWHKRHFLMDVTMHSLHGLWIGLADRNEYRPVRDWLTQSATDLILQLKSTVTDVSTTRPPPDLVIIGESWPDEFTADDVSHLLTIAPLARVVWITGAWSEAVGRTRSHGPPAWRVPLWDAITRIERELAALRACRNAAPGVAMDFPPATASRQETWLWQSSSSSPLEGHGSVYLGEIADPALTAWLRESLSAAGYTMVDHAADIVLLDVEPWSPVMAAKTCEAIARHPDSIPVVLTGWSTPELRMDLAQLRIEHVVDKLRGFPLPSRARLGSLSLD